MAGGDAGCGAGDAVYGDGDGFDAAGAVGAFDGFGAFAVEFAFCAGCGGGGSEDVGLVAKPGDGGQESTTEAFVATQARAFANAVDLCFAVGEEAAVEGVVERWERKVGDW